MIRTPTLEIWATFTIICAFCIGLALISLLGTVVVYRRRHKKRLQRLQQRRQHQLLRTYLKQSKQFTTSECN